MTRPTGFIGDRPQSRLTHVDEHGKAHMVDVTSKDVTRRVAEARCTVRSSADISVVLASRPGGHDLVEMARVAGVQAAKATSLLVPLCHPLLIDPSTVEIAMTDGGLAVRAVTRVTGRTGVEMEALTACAVAGLVLCHALLEHDPETSVEDLTLWHKSGGRTGTWDREPGDGRPGEG